MSSSSSTFTGDHQKEYEEFAEYLEQYAGQLFTKSPEEQKQEFARLGAVSHSDSYYYEPTAEVQNYARDFFAAFWSEPENVQAVDDRQKKKFVETRKRSNAPSCISFVSVKAESSQGLQNICLIAISSSGSARNPELYSQVKEFIEKYNATLEGNYRFELVDLASDNFQKLILQNLKHIRSIQEKNNRNVSPVPAEEAKDCAEKGFGTEVAKIFYDRAVHGRKMEVTGVLNCPFYPYSVEQYNENADRVRYVTSPRKVANNNSGEKLKATLSDKKEYWTPFIYCCKNCQAYKNVMYCVSLGAVAYGAQIYRKNAEKNSSPLKPPTLSKLMMTSPMKINKVTPLKKFEEEKVLKEDVNTIARNFSNLFKDVEDEDKPALKITTDAPSQDMPASSHHKQSF